MTMDASMGLVSTKVYCADWGWVARYLFRGAELCRAVPVQSSASPAQTMLLCTPSTPKNPSTGVWCWCIVHNEASTHTVQRHILIECTDSYWKPFKHVQQRRRTARATAVGANTPQVWYFGHPKFLGGGGRLGGQCFGHREKIPG